MASPAIPEDTDTLASQPAEVPPRQRECDVTDTLGRLLAAAGRCERATAATYDDERYAAVEMDRARWLLALAARDHTRTVNALPADQRPAGWTS